LHTIGRFTTDGSSYVLVRFEGSTSTWGTVGNPNIVYEALFSPAGDDNDHDDDDDDDDDEEEEEEEEEEDISNNNDDDEYNDGYVEANPEVEV
jgi:hypothetical protein